MDFLKEMKERIKRKIYKPKTMRDISSPETIKKAEEFTKMIKNGTIKNRHVNLYNLDNEFTDALNEMRGKPFSSKYRFEKDFIDKE